MSHWCRYLIFPALLHLGCSDGDSEADDASHTEATDPGEVTDSSPGALDAGDEDVCADRGVPLEGLEVESQQGIQFRLVQAQPEEQIVGDNAWRFELQQDDELVEGLADVMTVTPFMPDHGHGTAVAVGVAEVEPGEYELSPVNLRMPGYWLITIEIAGDGGADVAQFGVCVE